ncbi:MAG: hypothetical protein NT175_00610 [Bacteroidetes bacterium]|nr:hypothetical protein [Bacteroidota bacterium]
MASKKKIKVTIADLNEQLDYLKDQAESRQNALTKIMTHLHLRSAKGNQVKTGKGKIK